MLCEKDASHRVIALSWIVSSSSSWFAFVKIVLFIIGFCFYPSFSLSLDERCGDKKVRYTTGTSTLVELYDFLMGLQSLQPAAITAN